MVVDEERVRPVWPSPCFFMVVDEERVRPVWPLSSSWWWMKKG